MSAPLQAVKMRDRCALPARRQRGVVLFIALIVLVAMSLAGIAMLRSVDTALGVAGNLSFKAATMQASDSGVNTAYTWLTASGNAAALSGNTPVTGYYPTISTDPNWFDGNWWAANSVALNNGNADSLGNIVHYAIHLMCDSTGNCASNQASSSAPAGSSNKVGSIPPKTPPAKYYRITTRVDGPRNTVTIVQTFVQM